MFPGGPLFVLLLLATAVSVTASPGRLEFADDAAPIEASLYSLPSDFFAVDDAARFLGAARDGAPGRRILVACDRAMCEALAGRLGPGAIAFLPNSSGFSPWPRDPFLFARGGDGRVFLLTRPNTQPGREADAGLAKWLASSLSDALDEPAGDVGVVVSPWPFHGGQLLQEGGRLWLTLHSVERRALTVLGLDRVPVETFSDPVAVDRYARAARRAAEELGAILGRRAEFAHPLPASAADGAGPDLFRRVGAAAGRDLDTYLTFLPRTGGSATALVGDLRAGAALAASASNESLEDLRRVYDLAPRSEDLRRALLDAQREASGFADYLDLVAADLARRGLEVRRLALLRVPTVLLVDRAGVVHPDFLIGWNNVVVERRSGVVCAEGFASGWAPGDEAAKRVFREGGASLRLLPPLLHSIVLGGGYRCASNHLRRGG
jgi:hypothetical protein